jgi:hypothetical protein
MPAVLQGSLLLPLLVLLSEEPSQQQHPLQWLFVGASLSLPPGLVQHEALLSLLVLAIQALVLSLLVLVLFLLVLLLSSLVLVLLVPELVSWWEQLLLALQLLAVLPLVWHVAAPAEFGPLQLYPGGVLFSGWALHGAVPTPGLAQAPPLLPHEVVPLLLPLSLVLVLAMCPGVLVATMVQLGLAASEP